MIQLPIKNMKGITEFKLKKENLEFFNKIFDKIKIDNISLSERIWLYQNKLIEPPFCPNCGINKLKFKKFYIGYYKYCSKKCAAEYTHKDICIKNKKIKKLLECNNDATIRKNMTLKSIETKNNFSIEKKKRINEKRRKTNIDRYGVDIISKNYDIKQKIKNSNIITKKNNKESNFRNKIKKYGFELISMNNDDITVKNQKCNHKFDIHISLFNQRNRLGITICTICNPINGVSDFENKIKEFIKSIYDDEIICNKRFGKYEVDILLPNINLGFECNGLWWHSEVYRENQYHINKYNFFKEKNIKIINIWEDWWIYKNDIVKSMILDKLGQVPTIIYGRKCEIKEITDNKLVREFLEKNHIQGFINSSIKLGLFYNEELVSLMIFGKRRIKKNTKESEYELLRFCSKLNTNIIRAADKLFKYFVKNYKPVMITTYIDQSWSTGDLYEKLGFKFNCVTHPNYYYFHKDERIRFNKFNFRKDILVKDGYDSNKTEHQIMTERNFYRIYDCGNLNYIFTI